MCGVIVSLTQQVNNTLTHRHSTVHVLYCSDGFFPTSSSLALIRKTYTLSTIGIDWKRKWTLRLHASLQCSETMMNRRFVVLTNNVYNMTVIKRHTHTYANGYQFRMVCKSHDSATTSTLHNHPTYSNPHFSLDVLRNVRLRAEGCQKQNACAHNFDCGVVFMAVLVRSLSYCAHSLSSCSTQRRVQAVHHRAFQSACSVRLHCVRFCSLITCPLLRCLVAPPHKGGSVKSINFVVPAKSG